MTLRAIGLIRMGESSVRGRALRGVRAGGGAARVGAGAGEIPGAPPPFTEVGRLIRDSWFYLIVWAVIAAAGMLAQLAAQASPGAAGS